MSRLLPDPNRKSFWQFQGISEEKHAAPGTLPRMVAVFQHAVEDFGVTALSEDIAYPNKREYTLSELEQIRNAPLHPKAPKSNPQEAEKNREIVNLARAGLTAKEFGRALEAMSIKSARAEVETAAPKETFEGLFEGLLPLVVEALELNAA